MDILLVRVLTSRYIHHDRIVSPSLLTGALVREPLDRLDPNHSDLDVFEIIMYVMALAFAFEGRPSKIRYCVL